MENQDKAAYYQDFPGRITNAKAIVGSILYLFASMISIVASQIKPHTVLSLMYILAGMILLTLMAYRMLWYLSGMI